MISKLAYNIIRKRRGNKFLKSLMPKGTNLKKLSNKQLLNIKAWE